MSTKQSDLCLNKASRQNLSKSAILKIDMKLVYLILGLVVLVGGFLLLRNQKPSSPSAPKISQETSSMQYVFEDPKKSAHYETNTPNHAVALAGVPVNVVIDFNFDLAKPSRIEILKDGKDFGLGETIIDEGKLTMRRNMDPNSTDGLYKVEYNACWPDGSCHDGFFQFAIDKSLKEGFVNSTNQNNVEIRMSEIMFKPQNIRISKGTAISWVNDDSVEHYVNTDSHPAHTYYKNQNSKALKNGESYSVTFDTPGIYSYHCSVHADQMTGNILVE